MFVQSVHYTINQEQECNIRNVSEVHDVACGLNLKEEMGNKAEKAPHTCMIKEVRWGSMCWQ